MVQHGNDGMHELGHTVTGINKFSVGKLTIPLGINARILPLSERCRSGRTGLTRNQVRAYVLPGFESLPLRQNQSVTKWPLFAAHFQRDLIVTG